MQVGGMGITKKPGMIQNQPGSDISPQKTLGKLRGLSPQQQEREKNFHRMQQTNASITSSQIAQQNEEELTRLMTSPVRAKMQFSN